MQNRRNLYRLLHVQRDAPTEVIKSSYRTLMQTLRQHPDLGGDDWNAQLLNEARRTLCDPWARAQYDAAVSNDSRERASREGPRPRASRRTPPPGTPAGATTGTPGGGEPSSSRPASPSTRPGEHALRISPALHGAQAGGAGSYCHYCLAHLPAAAPVRTGYATVDGCRRCGAPTHDANTPAGARGASERRALHRVPGHADATILRHWPLNLCTPAALLEFSTAGCALDAQEALADETVVLLRTEAFTATGTVRSSVPVPDGETWRTGVEFLSVAMHVPAGTIFSTSV